MVEQDLALEILKDVAIGGVSFGVGVFVADPIKSLFNPQPDWAVAVLKNIEITRWRPDGLWHPTKLNFLGTGVWQDPTDPAEVADGAFYLGWTGNGFDPDCILEIWKYREPERLAFQVMGIAVKVYFADVELTQYWQNPSWLMVEPLAPWMEEYL